MDKGFADDQLVLFGSGYSIHEYEYRPLRGLSTAPGWALSTIMSVENKAKPVFYTSKTSAVRHRQISVNRSPV